MAAPQLFLTVARNAGLRNILTLDVGGTSADIGLAQEGRLRMKHLLDTKVGPRGRCMATRHAWAMAPGTSVPRPTGSCTRRSRMRRRTWRRPVRGGPPCPSLAHGVRRPSHAWPR